MDLSTLFIVGVILLGTGVSVASFRNIKKYASQASEDQESRVLDVTSKIENSRQRLDPYLKRR